MFKSAEGSTRRLIELCAGYFIFYVITGVAVKFFMGKASLGFPGMSDMQYLVYSTAGGTSIALLVVIAMRWFNLQSNKLIKLGPFTFPYEYLYIIPSGICTAVVIPTTTLMYTLPISVMVAMIIMRASIIIISRLIDAVQIAQKILHKKVYWQEDVAVVFAMIAACINIFDATKDGGFNFIKNPVAVGILSSYLVAYAIRLYIMNFYKNTRAPGVKQDNKGFFAVEQISAFFTMLVVVMLVLNGTKWFGWTAPQILGFQDAVINPPNLWQWALLAGTAYGIVAFFSVFLFLFKGRTATFAGLVNRLTSLVAGTTATLVCWYYFHMKFPSNKEWISLVFILIAVVFLSSAEKKRVKELLVTHEIEADAKEVKPAPKAAAAPTAVPEKKELCKTK